MNSKELNFYYLNKQELRNVAMLQILLSMHLKPISILNFAFLKCNDVSMQKNLKLESNHRNCDQFASIWHHNALTQEITAAPSSEEFAASDLMGSKMSILEGKCKLIFHISYGTQSCGNKLQKHLLLNNVKNELLKQQFTLKLLL